jgi:FO synthase
MSNWQALKTKLLAGEQLDSTEALSIASIDDTAALVHVAGSLRDQGHDNIITYSRKVFIPLTQLCRDVCHYCTFAQTPKKLEQIYMPVEEVVALCHEGAKAGCQEALFTLGERPELRYNAARRALEEMGYSTTLEYVQAVAARVLQETGLLPHINAGCMTAEEIAGLRQVSASMGIMLESASSRLCEKGQPHYGSPDKDPVRRLETLELAGEANVPFTSGILIGIGETRLERVESLLALREVHQRHGHLQEIIVQNFRAKPNTLMAQSPEPDLNELLWTIAVTRLIFGAAMNIQAPPNLSPGVLPQLVAAGINDWGGVSPLTPDHVNPEAPWPHLDNLARESAAAGKFLEQRLTIYPQYAMRGERWLDKALRTPVLRHMDSSGYARRDSWSPGEDLPVPEIEARLLREATTFDMVGADVREIVSRCEQREALSEADVTRLFNARGADFSFISKRANALREQVNGDEVSYVVTRNINYTNVCSYKCQFCAFSKGSGSEDLRGRPYDIDAEEIARRTQEAWQRGATEVCMQGGIHPDYTGETYLDILRTVKAAEPDMHIHAFSPLEVWQGADTLGIGLAEYFERMREAGLGTLPGTAAEVLHDEVRAKLCPDKLNSQQWLEVMEAAHVAGFNTTATIMYGHVDEPRHWARHLMSIRSLQQRTGGFTEFVPLPFVHMEAPMYRKGNSRKGPSFREAILMHAVSRLVFHGLIDNIQASWVKMGQEGVAACLEAGVNDLGGTLMNESITRAAGTQHGQEWSPAVMEAQIRALGRVPRMRNTVYGNVSSERYTTSFATGDLTAVVENKAGKRQSNKRLASIESQPVRLVQSLAPVSSQVILMAACN